MRKIEQQMIRAISNNTDWQSANTRVVYSPIRGTSEVYLHNNLIAIVTDDSVQLFDGGWQTNTTKSRLNAILQEFGFTCGTKTECIFQRQFEWFIQAWDETAKQLVTKEFSSGMILA